MKLFDSHCHLDDRAFDKDLDDIVHRMHEAGVASAMTIGSNLERCIKGVAIAESIPGVYASVGIHPHAAKSCNEDVLKSLMDLTHSPTVRAWGEIGLDFNRMFSPGNVQEKWLIRQLEIAHALDLPVIFHERDSNGRLLDILKTHFKTGQRGVVHCFSGSENELKQYLDLDLYIGITGIVTIKGRGADLRRMVPLIPVDRIMIETDAPYLTPTPERNHTQRNEPAFVRSVLLKLAEVRQEELVLLSETLWNNTCRLYGVEPDAAPI
ncbi:MAG: TatD family hydrolase [Deltaproteobacteria bacterium]|nr:TatD family hydrolase [Deltaproteobacteria bacterium]MBW2489807.1 TatD family hydrolase [Deltaproteobacteria bacterium]